MIKLSVNVNKVATLRNSRGGHLPSVLDATRVCVEAGAPGITVHPRADARHITARDVHEVAALLRQLGRGTEFNIEGDPRPELLALVHELKPTQCTIVPVHPGEITSQAGWPPNTPPDALASITAALRSAGIRVSLFVEADEAPIRWAKEVGADRVELYTEPFARAFERGAAAAQESFDRYQIAAEFAHALGLEINA
jgi:pyridoxine 5-phosphate synthase